MILNVVPKGTQLTAILYEGTNFPEVKRFLGNHVEKGNKFDANSSILVDTPYGVQCAHVGDVLVEFKHPYYWKVMTAEQFRDQFETQGPSSTFLF